ncbi:hypothetical protein [Neisseria polysaccharea]|uniref:hypothetical protein n=1 Tax=Neisseria polysaccharea TaxID=489 RepID=UPI00272AAFC9|nr:hypothetical protein [Neisseria polysaccharea]MCL5713036.1 hypothetical protein [Neisseria meningitidis]MCL6032853.1 hypothetical protein [Neisseria meningitidis]MCL6037030.1 hypothetical protein [Neisseria meningitidis]MCL6067641.1 hypothetical protein [Neisseria meningitidis]MCL6073827.1 hypothetical protein [Neisseria meningitidis]
MPSEISFRRHMLSAFTLPSSPKCNGTVIIASAILHAQYGQRPKNGRQKNNRL